MTKKKANKSSSASNNSMAVVSFDSTFFGFLLRDQKLPDDFCSCTSLALCQHSKSNADDDKYKRFGTANDSDGEQQTPYGQNFGDKASRMKTKVLRFY
jgi:hypothetical protein